jgi:two-component system, cell cycle sensor histidine kinase and response regulator CckA
MKPTGRPPQVLIVEDEAIISLDIKRLLSSSGYGVAAVAATADRAIRAIETSAPDLVLMDIHLKGERDGIETALHIRDTFHLPVIFVTAHADKATLERASQSEPFGYIVKPISALSLTSTIEMALHKHRIERQLHENRAWLSTVLQSIPDAVVVTDLAGQVQFLNSAGEQLLGIRQADVLGQPIDEVMAISSGDRNGVASQTLDKAEWGGRVSLPKDALLTLEPYGHQVPVEGDVVVSYSGGQPAGAIFTLRDVSRREQEEGIERQEERMLALGRLAGTIAHDFNSLHSLLSAACNDLSRLGDSLEGEQRDVLMDKTDTIARVNAIGLLMTEQLLSLSKQPAVRATLVSASGVLASVEPLLNKLGSNTLQVDIHLTDESTLVLCHPDRLSILLVNVFLNARERMGSSGRIRISTSQAAGNHAAIVFDLEHIGTPLLRSLAFPLEMENPDFSLSIAHALVSAMEGSISYTSLSDKEGRIEIFLPLQRASQEFVDATNRRGTVLLIGADLNLFGDLEEWLGNAHLGVIRCSSSAEALLLGQLYDNKIDCVIADASAVSAPNRRKVQTFFCSRNSAAKFVRLVSNDQPDEPGWQSFSKSPQASILEYLSRLFSISESKVKASH